MSALAEHPDFQDTAKVLDALCIETGVGWGDMLNALRDHGVANRNSRDEAMMEDYRAGMTIKKMCFKYGVTKEAIGWARARTGTHARKRGCEDRDAKMAELWADGLLCSDIARELGMTLGGVLSMRRRLGLPKRHKSNQARPELGE